MSKYAQMKTCGSSSRFAAILAFCCVTLLASCASGATHTASGKEIVQVTLGPEAEHARLNLDDKRYEVSLERIHDSRCPADAQCVWAGELAARLKLDRLDVSTPSREITLGQETVPSIEVLGVRLELVSIDETTVTFSARAGD